MPETVEPEILTAADLLKLGFEEDSALLEELSLCSVCSYTCTTTSAQN